jgi:hypothetical protein
MPGTPPSSTLSDESESRDPSDPAYLTHAALWVLTAANRGHQMVADGALTEAERAAAPHRSGTRPLGFALGGAAAARDLHEPSG